jgi:molybdopterin-containing oxidoreductase family iron-sulfur binding subunit
MSPMMNDDDEPVTISTRADVNRRDALKLVAGGIAALGVGCLDRPGQVILPYVDDPPESRPGVATRYASALVIDGYARGVLVETHDGRPTKLDGNPAHPAMLGGSTPIVQARILDLYDPQRLQEVVAHGEPSIWSAISDQLARLTGRVWLVLPPQTSPTVAALLAAIRARVELHVVWHAPLSRRQALHGNQLALGELVEQQLDPARSDVVVALDADWLNAMPMSVAWARRAATRRVPEPLGAPGAQPVGAPGAQPVGAPGAQYMSRLWACEPMPTPSSSIADERLAVRAGDVVWIAVAIVHDLAQAGLRVPRLPDAVVRAARDRLGEAATRWAQRAADDLAAHRGAGATIVGDRQPAAVHALARWIDAACDNASTGGPVHYTRTPLVDPLGGDTLAELAAALRAHAVDAVVVVDADPVYAAPRVLGLPDLLARAPYAVHVSLYPDATTRACAIRVPLAHELEAWSDARAGDGTRSVAQPVIRPRFPVASTLDVLAALAGDPREALAIVRADAGLNDAAWRAALATGVVAGSAELPRALVPTASDAVLAELDHLLADPRPEDTVEVALAPSVLYDGRFAGNAWLQELPHPFTKQTWGNAALVSESTAAALGADDGDVVEIATPSGAISLPALVVRGHADQAITIEVGYGHTSPDLPIAHAIGANAFALRGEADRLVLTARARRGPGRRKLARTQTVTAEHDREVAPDLAIAQLRASADRLARLRGPAPSLLAEPTWAGVGWGMTIDTTKCTGCSACMVACQAENNIPVVGSDDVARGRHMNWIRVDRYDTSFGYVNEPMPCQHCERAPCEYVCPVEATEHSPDGLNEMVYNRCIGTRFCSNNCPYKVRRFNWFAYERENESALQYNPDVTVRSRGVMEKCTYCVQRIRRAEIDARVEARAIRVGEVVTACMAACPTGAIVFGNLAEVDTEFARSRHDARAFEVLHDLGTRPRTRYLAKVRNPR